MPPFVDSSEYEQYKQWKEGQPDPAVDPRPDPAKVDYRSAHLDDPLWLLRMKEQAAERAGDVQAGIRIKTLILRSQRREANRALAETESVPMRSARRVAQQGQQGDGGQEGQEGQQPTPPDLSTVGGLEQASREAEKAEDNVRAIALQNRKLLLQKQRGGRS